MIAIAESGSTKTAWFIINEYGNIISEFNTQGFNPDFHDSSEIINALSNSEDIKQYNEEICKVYFFGASCSNAFNIGKVEVALRKIFPISVIFVDHDLLACAYALTNGSELITCILGTGSNSAYFDGEKLREEVPALGVFMGDEGSGGYFGKQLIRDYFYGRLPTDIHTQLELDYELKWSEVRQIIYGSNHANVYLASFMPFIYQFHTHDYVKNMIKKGIDAFIDIHVNCFKNYPSKQVGFVGSMAYLFQDQLKISLESHGYELAKVIKSPGRELVKYLIEEKGVIEKSPESLSVKE